MRSAFSSLAISKTAASLALIEPPPVKVSTIENNSMNSGHTYLPQILSKYHNILLLRNFTGCDLKEGPLLMWLSSSGFKEISPSIWCFRKWVITITNQFRLGCGLNVCQLSALVSSSLKTKLRLRNLLAIRLTFFLFHSKNDSDFTSTLPPKIILHKWAEQANELQ